MFGSNADPSCDGYGCWRSGKFRKLLRSALLRIHVFNSSLGVHGVVHASLPNIYFVDNLAECSVTRTLVTWHIHICSLISSTSHHPLTSSPPIPLTSPNPHPIPTPLNHRRTLIFVLISPRGASGARRAQLHVAPTIADFSSQSRTASTSPSHTCSAGSYAGSTSESDSDYNSLSVSASATGSAAGSAIAGRSPQATPDQAICSHCEPSLCGSDVRPTDRCCCVPQLWSPQFK